MSQFQQLVSLIVCLSLVSLLSSSEAAEESTTGGTTAAAVVPVEMHQSHEQIPAVTEWFKTYDQIRRDAEMTMSEKLESLVLRSKPGRKNIALTNRMNGKYTIALTQMQELQSVPETKELQDGYIDFFSKAKQLMSNYIEPQAKISDESLVLLKQKLEILDKKNKTLDEKLRRRYVIKKHKHN